MSTTAAPDLNVTPKRDVAKWSETRWNGCWCPEAGVGLYLHMGRFRKDLDMWWAQTVAYLPDGKLAVERTWGRDDDEAAVRTGPFELRQEAGGWASTFDGVAELTTTALLAEAPRGAAAPSVRMQWDVRAEASAPVWDMYGGRDERHEFAGDTHIQQAHRTSGTLTVDGQDYPLDGVGYKDHSSGVRAWDGYGSHGFVLAVMPEWTLHAIMLHGPGGEPRGPLGVLFRDGEALALERFEIEPIGDIHGGPNDGEIVVAVAGGEQLRLRAEILHQCPITITDEGDNINGIAWGSEPPTLALMEGAARMTAPDGSVGHAFHERGVLLDVLAGLRT